MSDPSEPEAEPSGGPEPRPDDLPPKTGTEARRERAERAANSGMESQGGDAPDPRGMMGEGEADEAAGAESGMLNQGGETGRRRDGMLGEG